MINKRKLKSEKFNQEYTLVELENGFKIYLFNKKGFVKKYAYFYTKYGSLGVDFIDSKGDLVLQPKGIAHFLEHKIFEDENKNIFSDFAQIGGNVNAFTTFNSTVYYFSSLDNFEKGIEMLSSFVTNLYLTEENVNKEKGIIIQEIKMYDDDANWRTYFNGLSKLYEIHPIKYDIAGDEKSVSSTSKSDLEYAYEHFYSPKNMSYLLIGDFDEENIINEVIKSLPEEFMNRTTKGVVDLKVDYSPVTDSIVEMDMGLNMPMFDYFIKINDVKEGKESLKDSLCKVIGIGCAFGRGTEFYRDLYEMDLINTSFGTEHNYGKGFSYITLGGESKNPMKVKELIIENFNKIRTEGIKEDIFNRVIRKMKGRTIQSLNSLSSIGNSFIGYDSKELEYFMAFDILDSITLDDVNNSMKIDIEGNDLISIVR
jgi:predicted Zn-dependent peptidase